MEAPKAAEVETKSEKPNETERPKSYNCELCDTEVVYKIAQELLPGLASACVDNTTGGIFTTAGSVAVDLKNDMADYLTTRSETYAAEFLLSENSNGLEISEHPYDIIVNLIDDFSAAKRNMLSRVSELVLSDRREDRIDDFVQEMEKNGFWLVPQREHIASVLLKNVDYKNAFHCNLVFDSMEEVMKHRLECKFRPMDCTNEGCQTRYCVAQKEHHLAVCPFMILPCEQKCSDFVTRREMDRHCVTVCPVKLVKCAFFTVGCKFNIPRCDVQKHNAEDLSSHLLYIIRTVHKDASEEDLKQRVEQIRNLSNIEKLAKARDARALTFLIKDSEAKLETPEVKTTPNAGESAESASHDSDKKESLPTKTESTEKPAITEVDANSPGETTASNERSADSLVKTEESEKKDEKGELLKKKEVSSDSEKEDGKTMAAIENKKTESPIKGAFEEQSQREAEEMIQSSKREKVNEESMKSREAEKFNEESMKSPKAEKVNEESMKSSEAEKVNKELMKSPKAEKVNKESMKAPEAEKVNEESMKSLEAEKVNKELTKSPKPEKVNEESMKSPEAEKVNQESIKSQEAAKVNKESMKSPETEKVNDESMKSRKAEKINESMKSPEREKVTEESMKSPIAEKVNEESIKSPKKETITKTKNSDEQDSKKSHKEEKRKQLSSSDEEDAQKLSKTETFKDSSTGYEEESPKKETFKDSYETENAFDSEEDSPKKETFKETYETENAYESDEESMKSPLDSESEETR